MEIDEDCNSNVFCKPTTTGLNLNTFVKPVNPPMRLADRIVSASSGRLNAVSQMNTPVKSHVRRGSSGIFFNNMFCGYFRHLKKLHMETNDGLNAIRQPPARAIFRSSLPATPIATPIYRESFPFFTEAALMERLCRTPSPRRTLSRNSYNQMEVDEREGTPMDICSPTIDEEDSAGSTPKNSTQPEQSEFQSNIDSIYYKINDQFSPD